MRKSTAEIKIASEPALAFPSNASDLAAHPIYSSRIAGHLRQPGNHAGHISPILWLTNTPLATGYQDLPVKSGGNSPKVWAELINSIKTIIEGAKELAPEMVAFVFQGWPFGRIGMTPAVAAITPGPAQEAIP